MSKPGESGIPGTARPEAEEPAFVCQIPVRLWRAEDEIMALATQVGRQLGRGAAWAPADLNEAVAEIALNTEMPNSYGIDFVPTVDPAGDPRRIYDIGWTWDDSETGTYLTSALLTKREAAAMEVYLEAIEESGAIRDPFVNCSARADLAVGWEAILAEVHDDLIREEVGEDGPGDGPEVGPEEDPRDQSTAPAP